MAAQGPHLISTMDVTAATMDTVYASAGNQRVAARTIRASATTSIAPKTVRSI